MISLLDRKRRNRHEEALAAPTPEAPHSTPSLLLLTDDAAGPAARRLHAFPTTGDADDFIRFWFPPTRRDGLIAFWALHHEPDDDALPAEAVIIVRDTVDADLVFTFSLVDMESALIFLRDEAQTGLDLSLVLLYWALPVAIDTADPNAVVFSPAEPPIPATPAPAVEPPAVPEPIAERVRPPISAPARKPSAPDALLREVAGVLRSRRWEQHQEAFQGFGSPPGRF